MSNPHRRRRTRARRRDGGAAEMVGMMLGLGLVVMMLPALINLSNSVEEWSDEQAATAQAQADEMRAERERAEQAAWCTRHPDQEPNGFDCPGEQWPPGYECQWAEGTNAFVCYEHDNGGGTGGGLGLPETP